ncbi:MAG: sigma-70 family RNA polymerase sigma factor [Fimbriimonadaceae bacterium]|nr:sigma-70 family RNA polymerase sigma factor [Fimbriimonadaceae bacterium]
MGIDFWAAYDLAFQRYCWASSGDDSYDRLEEYIFHHLNSLARQSLIDTNDSLDIASQSILKLRAAYSNCDPKAKFCDERGEVVFAKWVATVNTTFRRILIDDAKGKVREPAEDINWERIPDKDLNPEEKIALDNAEQIKQIRTCADRLWLGSQRRHHNERLRFLQLIISDGLSPAEASEFVHSLSQVTDKDRNTTIATWISDQVCLNYAFYSYLHLDSFQLISILLDYPIFTPSDISHLRIACQNNNLSESMNEDWTWTDVSVILMHYYSQKRDLFITSHLCGNCSIDQIHQIIDRCVTRYPFIRMMESLGERIEACNCPSDSLKDPSLWKRLAFEYYHVDGLEFKEVCLRLIKPSEVCGIRLTEAMLHGWLFGGRLLKQLIKFMEKHDGGPRP